MRATALIAAMCFCISSPIVTCGQGADDKAPRADFTFRNADETYALIESASKAKVGMTSKYTGKTVKLEGCWFNPLSDSFLDRERNQEGVYMVSFKQGGKEWSKGTALGNTQTLYTKGDAVNFYIDSGDRVQQLKTGWELAEAAFTKAGSRWSDFQKVNLYFEIVDRPSKKFGDKLIHPCAKLLHVELAP
jgi:hypothetical protein